MNGLAVVLFASFSGQAATDEQDEERKEIYYNTGTKNFINNVIECISEGKYGLEFIEKY